MTDQDRATDLIQKIQDSDWRLEWEGSGWEPNVTQLRDVMAAAFAAIHKEERDAAEFWSKWVYPDGATAEQVQNELVDYYYVMNQVSQVYNHITGGMLSKPGYAAKDVIRAADDYQQTLIDDAVRYTLEEIGENEI